MHGTLASTTYSSTALVDLGKIREHTCSLAIWQRPRNPDYAGLIEGDPSDIRFNTPVKAVAGSLTAEMAKAGFGSPELHSDFVADVAVLAERYGSILGLDTIQLRLEIVTTDSCRKWHADYVTARLITTYVGSGTQYLDAGDSNRVRNGLGPARINSLDTGDVGLFKGKLGYGEPAIHRSPPIGDSGERRLLLVLNPVERG